MIDEAAIRARALQFAQGQHVGEPGSYPEGFSEAVQKYLTEIPIDRTGMRYCPACECALCGICQKCHEVDREFLFIGRPCPESVPTAMRAPGQLHCVAWCWAYIFLNNAQKALR